MLEQPAKPDTEPVPILRCRNNECKAWIREEMSTSPECPLCKGPMVRSIKHLPKLVKKIKRQKKQAEETSWA